MNNELQVTAVFDLDGTITRNDTYLSFLLTYLKLNPGRLINCWSLPFVVLTFKLGLKDNTWLKKKFLNAILGGVSRFKLEQFVCYFLKITHQQKLNDKAIQEILLHKKLGHNLILATASFDFYARKLGEQLGFDTVICTRSRWDQDDRLLGDIDGGNCYGEVKLEKVRQYFQDRISSTHSVLYTDHHSDLPLMEWVDEAIAVNPTKKMRELAVQRSFEIREW